MQQNQGGVPTDVEDGRRGPKVEPKVGSHVEPILFVTNPAELAAIMSDTVQLAVFRQEKIPKYVEALKTTSFDDAPSFEGLCPLHELPETLKSRLWCPYGLRSQQNRTFTEEDVDGLIKHVTSCAEVFADIATKSGFLGDDVIALKIAVTRDDGCRFWHQDSVPFRMVATFRGPCTEWVPVHASKATLRRRQFNSKHSQSLSLTDVALFKGRGDVDPEELYDQPGIVHRSPRNISGDYRVVFVVDIPQEGMHY